MYISILGRQPDIGLAELRRVYGEANLFSSFCATVETDTFNLDRLGGTLKAGVVVAEFEGDIKKTYQKIATYYTDLWSSVDYKITLGIR